jgi:Uma2 family endonuclease
MAVAQRMSEEQYQQFVLAQPDGQWELHDGRLVEKPGVTWEHADIAAELAYLLRHQIPRDEYRVFIESRVRRPAATIFLPDVMVVPTEYGEPFRGRPSALAIFSDPLPLIVEIWFHCRSSSRSGHRRRASTTSTPSCLSTSSGVTLKSGASTPTSEH